MAIDFSFKVALPTEPIPFFWGSGITSDQDMSAKGWRCKRLVPGNPKSTWLFGQPGKPGCATLVVYEGENYVDVAIYVEDPATVRDCETRSHLDPVYRQFRIEGNGRLALDIVLLIQQELEAERSFYAVQQ